MFTVLKMQLVISFLLMMTVTLCNCSPMENGEKYCFDIIMKIARDSKKNTFLSVGGLLESISLLYEASDKETNAAIKNVTGFSSSKITHHTEYSRLKNSIMETKGRETTFIQKSVIFHDEAVTILPNFQEILQKFYQCNVITIPKSYSEKENLNKIHHEIDLYTNSTLDKKFFDSVLSSLVDTEVMIISTNHFKSLWATPFDPLDTKNRPFNNNDGTTTVTQFMEGTGRYMAHHVSELKSTLLNLQYLNSQFSLLILLPDENVKVDMILENNGLDWNQIRNFIPVEYSPMSVIIPKFKLDAHTEMNEYLSESGLADLFKKLDIADMTPERQLSLSNIYQISHFEIDETGTSASSSIHMSIGFRSLQIPKTVQINRPFLFFIIHSKILHPVYVGKVLSF